MAKKNELNFRQINFNYLLLVDDKNIDSAFEDFEHEDDDNALLVYGYIDHDEGLGVEVLCVANIKEGSPVELRGATTESSLKIKYEDITGELYPVGYDDNFKRYEAKVNLIEKYNQAVPAVETFRDITSLDAFRLETHPDLVNVDLLKDDVGTERAVCRLVRSVGERIVGTLQKNPEKNFGVYEGDMVYIEPEYIGDELHAVAKIR